MKPRYLLLSLVLGLLLTAALLVTLGGHSGVASAERSSGVVEAREAESLAAQDVISTAYVLVRFGAHDSILRPVTFTEPISAYRALELSGLAFTTQDTGFGPFLCSIEEVGDSSPDCDNPGRYWATYAWDADAGSWAPRMVGIADAMISEDGHVEGFSWSDPGWTAVTPPPAPALVSASQGLAWLKLQQQADGSFGGGGATAEVLMALAANRVDARDVQQPGGASALAGMWLQARALAETPAGAGKLALAMAAQESCWLYGVPQPMAYYNETTGAFDADAAPQVLAMLGTAALGDTIPATATAYLLDLQQPDGAWEWGAGWGTDTNTTALAVQALIAAGEAPTSTAVLSALAYLETAQNADGGFPYDPDSAWGTDSDANSTAYVLQALLAAGLDPTAEPWDTGGANPVAFLMSLQLADGSFEWQPGLGGSTMATQQAVTALFFNPLPVRSVELSPCRITFLPLVARD